MWPWMASRLNHKPNQFIDDPYLCNTQWAVAYGDKWSFFISYWSLFFFAVSFPLCLFLFFFLVCLFICLVLSFILSFFFFLLFYPNLSFFFTCLAKQGMNERYLMIGNNFFKLAGSIRPKKLEKNDNFFTDIGKKKVILNDS